MVTEEALKNPALTRVALSLPVSTKVGTTLNVLIIIFAKVEKFVLKHKVQVTATQSVQLRKHRRVKWEAMGSIHGHTSSQVL